MSQFKRVVEVTITDTERNTAMTINNLAVSFRISKSLVIGNNKAYVEIKNMSETTRNKLDNLEKTLLLKVGYEGESLKTLFYGNITTFFDEYNTPDITTKIECIDGNREFKKAKISVTYKRSISVKKIINDIVNLTGWDYKNSIYDLDVDDQFPSIGFAYTGYAADALDDLTGMIEVDWSFQDGTVQFTTADGLATKDIVVVSKENGLISIPQKTDKKGVRNKRRKKKNVSRSQSEPGYIIRSLIKPLAKPGASVHLISNTLNIDNTFKIGDVSHSGGNYIDLWETRMKALLPINTFPVNREAITRTIPESVV